MSIDQAVCRNTVAVSDKQYETMRGSCAEQVLCGGNWQLVRYEAERRKGLGEAGCRHAHSSFMSSCTHTRTSRVTK